MRDIAARGSIAIACRKPAHGGDRGVKDVYDARDAWDTTDAAACDPEKMNDDAPP